MRRREKIAFPVLEGKLAERGLLDKDVAVSIGISPRAFSGRMTGSVPFTWDEICKLQQNYFPHISKEELMQTKVPTA